MRQNMTCEAYLMEQINEQQYSYSKSGHLQFSHPENAHDDMLGISAQRLWGKRAQKTTSIHLQLSLSEFIK